MKTPFAFLTLFFISNIILPSNKRFIKKTNNQSTINYPSLIVTASESPKYLPARTHIFSEIIIQEGAELVIQEGARNWCVLVSEGGFILNGKITFTRFNSGAGVIDAITPNNLKISHKFSETSLGGDGGLGGESWSCGGRGGIGAKGSTKNGGGGGGGGGYGLNGRPCTNGDNGNNYSGGNAFSGGGVGGSGGRKDVNCNGGLLYILVKKNLNGKIGTINLNGLDGANGLAGQRGGGSMGFAGSGGGGGGAAGGDGGVLIMDVKGEILEYPRVNVQFGKGGLGGKEGGKRPGTEQSIPSGTYGQPGASGEDGSSGYVEYLN